MKKINHALNRIGSIVMGGLCDPASSGLWNDDAWEQKIIEAVEALKEREAFLEANNRKLQKKIEKLSQTSFPFIKNGRVF